MMPMSTFHSIFFGRIEDWSSMTPVFEPQELNHIYGARRLRKGDAIYFTDGKGFLFKTVIIDKNRFSPAEVVKKQEVCLPHINAVFGIIHHQDRLSFLVEKLTEMGVSKIIFIPFEYSVKRNVNIERLRRVSISALKQSGNLHLPEISVMDFSVLCGIINPHNTIVLSPDGIPITQISIKDKYAGKKELYYITGPEGGFSPREIQALKEIPRIKISHNVLRTETALICASSLLACALKM